MTTHYVTTLGVAKCREILKGAPEHSQVVVPCLDGDIYLAKRGDGKWFRFSDGYQKWLEFYGKCDPMDLAISLDDLRAELVLHDTYDFKHLANHISPNTVVVG